jgi:RHS repeat-associated protein
MTYPSGRVITTGRDDIGRTSGLSDTSNNYLSSISYNSAQLPTALTYGNGVQASFGYNDHLQLSSLSYTSGSNTLLNLAYNYLDTNGHNTGQIQSITDSRGTAYSTSYTYDPLGRLQQAETGDLVSPNTWRLSWGYDRYGNRLSQTLVGGTASAGQPQLTVGAGSNHITTSGFSYDAAGNLIKDGIHNYTYNGEGEITQVDSTISYAYDGHRWRIAKTVNSATTVYVYSGSKVIAEYPSGGAATTPNVEYIYSGSRLVATIAGTSVTYHHPDHLSNRLETNSSGAVTRTFGHMPFGDSWYETGTADKWKFTGYERDSTESGLDYAMHRFYSSGFGRFISPDLLHGQKRNPQSLNRYSYVTNDPVNGSDPLGLEELVLGGPPEAAQDDSGGFDLDFLFCASGLTCNFGGGGGGGGGLPNLFPEKPTPPRPGPLVLRILQIQQIIDSILNGSNLCADFFNSNSLVGPNQAANIYDNTNIQILDNTNGTYTSRAAMSSQESAFDPGNTITVWVNSPMGRPMQPANYANPGPPALLHLGSFIGGTLGADVLIMLHELGHILGVIPADGQAADPTGQLTKTNEKTIEGNCDQAVKDAIAAMGPGL